VVVTATAQESVLAVAKRMARHNVDAVVIVKPSSDPVAIVTDRDIVLRGVARALDPETTPIAKVMTREVRTVDETTPIEQALRTMASAGMRRLVVTGAGGQLVGLLSLDDVTELLSQEAESIGRLLIKEGTAPAVRS
jgi:signal-transduction protein with cAMP-binding, CBS, and nucleotidyltransferase domain